MAAAETTNAQAEYDLRKGGTQEFTVQDDDGTIIYVTITEIRGKTRVSNGTYKISYEVPLVWEAGFNVNIVSNQITSAYASSIASKPVRVSLYSFTDGTSGLAT